MLTYKDILGNLSGGRVLDVATGSGGFIEQMLASLKDYTEIIGVDTNERAATAFCETFKANPAVHFSAMDAHHLDYPADSFDTVCISNSLHHFADPLPVLQEMKRVLRQGGMLILSEMYCDNQTETQNTHVQLHHWWAAVDTCQGIVHRQTYRRSDLVEYAAELGLSELAFHDVLDAGQDPKAPELLAELDAIIERYIQRAAGHPALQQQGETLRRRVHEIGFNSATTLVAVGRKG